MPTTPAIHALHCAGRVHHPLVCPVPVDHDASTSCPRRITHAPHRVSVPPPHSPQVGIDSVERNAQLDAYCNAVVKDAGCAEASDPVWVQARVEEIWANFAHLFPDAITVTVNNVTRVYMDDVSLLRTNEMEQVVLPPDWQAPSNGGQWETSAVFSVKAVRDEEARLSMWTVTFIIFLLGVGMVIFSLGSRRLAYHITTPITELCEQMAVVSKLNFADTKLLPSAVFEIHDMQCAFLQMRSGIGSFAKYAPREVVLGLLSKGDEARLEVYKRHITIFFSHILHFDHLCESMPPPVLLEMLSHYFDCVAMAVTNSGGTLLDFIGDMVLAIWNAPQPIDNHACTAIDGTLKMLADVDMINAKWTAQNKQNINMSCGINSGDVFVGNIGADRRMKFSVLGDAVNLASRVQELNNMFHTKILITMHSREEPKVLETYVVRPVDCIVVKGKTTGTTVYNVPHPGGRKADASADLLEVQRLSQLAFDA